MIQPVGNGEIHIVLEKPTSVINVIYVLRNSISEHLVNRVLRRLGSKNIFKDHWFKDGSVSDAAVVNWATSWKLISQRDAEA